MKNENLKQERDEIQRKSWSSHLRLLEPSDPHRCAAVQEPEDGLPVLRRVQRREASSCLRAQRLTQTGEDTDQNITAAEHDLVFDFLLTLAGLQRLHTG